MAFWVTKMTQKIESSYYSAEIVDTQLPNIVDTRLDQWLAQVPTFSTTILREMASEEPREQHPDAFDAQGTLFAFERNLELFAHLTEQYPEESKAVLARASHSADVLARFAEGTNLTHPEKGLGLREAKALINWLCEIQPSQEEYVYQKFDLLRFSQDKQLENVRQRLLPHSLAAGLVSYILALQLNRAAGQQVIDPYHVLIQNLAHESQRMITHDVIVHDGSLLKVFLKALGHAEFAQDHGEAHPRILDIDTEDLTLAQLIQFVLWPGDAFTKASPKESAPFDTPDGIPQFRRAENGVSEVLNSLQNYNNEITPEEITEAQATGEYMKLLVKTFGHNIQTAIQYLIDLRMLSKIPTELEKHGVSLQSALDKVQPVWARVLTTFWQNKNLTKQQMAEIMNAELEAFIVANPA